MENRLTKAFPKHPKIIFMGTPDFAVASLKALIDHGHNISAVVTQPDRPKGRGMKVIASPVKKVATAHSIEVIQPERASEGSFSDKIRKLAPDVLVVVAFGQILKKALLSIPRWGALNVHASLLPKYRGAAPIQWAILNNETKTGLSAMRMDEGLDTGPVLLQKELPIGPDMTAGELHDRLLSLSGEFLLKALEGLSAGQLTEQTQDETRSSYAPKIDRQNGLIQWRKTARGISAIIRAMDPWPGAYTNLGGRNIKLFSPGVRDMEATDLVPGRVAGRSEGKLVVETGKGFLLVGELQASGKKRLPTNDFLRGFPISEGDVLG